MAHRRLVLASALAATCVLAIWLPSGCAPVAAEDQPPAQGGSMGMAGGSADGGVMVASAVAAARDATLTLGPDTTSSEGVVVRRVVAPADGWVVVRSTTAPGAVLGKTLVPKGTSENVLVRLEAAEGAQARLALHVDRGSPGTFEFEPERVGRSLDGPIYVDRRPVELQLALDSYGENVEANSVLILVEDQQVAAGELLVSYLITTRPSWISVNELEDGLPGRRIGLAKMGAGEVQQIRVPLTRRPVSEQLVVTVHADNGTPGSFEYEIDDPLGSVDQPYRSAGVIVSERIDVK